MNHLLVSATLAGLGVLPVVAQDLKPATAPAAPTAGTGVIVDVRPVLAPSGLALMTTASTPLDNETESLRKRVADLEAKLDALLKAQEAPKSSGGRIGVGLPQSDSTKALSRFFKVHGSGAQEHDHEEVEIHELGGNVFQWSSSDGSGGKNGRKVFVHQGKKPFFTKDVRVKRVGDPKFFVSLDEVDCEHERDEDACEHEEGVRRFISVKTDSKDFDFAGIDFDEMDLEDFGFHGVGFDEIDEEEFHEHLEELDIDFEDFDIDLEALDIDLEELLEDGDGKIMVKVLGSSSQPRVHVSGRQHVVVDPRTGNQVPRVVRRNFSARSDQGKRFARGGKTLFGGGSGRAHEHDEDEGDENDLHEEFADLLEEMHDELREMREVIDDLHDELRDLPEPERKSGR